MGLKVLLECGQVCLIQEEVILFTGITLVKSQRQTRTRRGHGLMSIPYPSTAEVKETNSGNVVGKVVWEHFLESVWVYQCKFISPNRNWRENH